MILPCSEDLKKLFAMRRRLVVGNSAEERREWQPPAPLYWRFKGCTNRVDGGWSEMPK